MAERLVNVDRQTPMLLPPDLREWVADNELAHLILEAVELCDMSGARLNVRGSGSEQYPPSMMMALLIYAYATGLFSSRRIERATYESVALRYLCANHHPDHDTIAKFRRENEALFRSCFGQVLLLAREAGVLHVGALLVNANRHGHRHWKWQQRRLMEQRFLCPLLQRLYQRRHASAEGAFARIKSHLGFRRFQVWGKSAATTEWMLVCLAHNCRILARAKS